MTSRQRVTLMDRSSPGMRVHLSAVIQEDGTLVFEGQDLGQDVLELWGDLDYEYWFRVAPQHRERLLTRLAESLFNDEEEAVRRWLHANGFHIPGPGDPDTALFGPCSMHRQDLDAATLLALRRAFEEDEVLAHGSLTAWLKDRGIPYQFDSYI